MTKPDIKGILRCARHVLIISALLITTYAHAGWMDQFIDPSDNKFDMSNFLNQQIGFMPVPIIITEPAVGYGAGVATVFLHDPLAGTTESGEIFDPQKSDHGTGRVIPPSMSAVAAAGTENGTWFAGGGHYGIWKQDRIRYLGGAGVANVNMKFYGLGGGLEPSDNQGLDFNTRALFLIQEIQFRIKDSNFFVGAKYNFLNADTTFETSKLFPIEGIPDLEFNSRSASLGLVVNYDGRDNIFTPSKGLSAEISADNYSENWGGDADFNKYRAFAKYWHPLGEKFVLGLRGDGQKLSDGPAPFYEYPFVELRGIPVMRYQGEEVLVGEAELRWDVNSRWSLVGIDVARGPEDTAFYIQVDNAWAR